ncbi:MAG: hypothetical protein PHS82_08230 [Lachnospiraceae bacterium]|nr:hypothetical protein [Lachnospiraceae bacterium]
MGIIREAREQDVIKIKQLTDENISVNFYTLSFLRTIIDDPKQYLLVYENEEKEIVAYLYMFCASLQEALTILHIPVELLVSNGVLPETKIVVFKTTCTHKKYRSRGILTSLIDYAQKKVLQIDLHSILLTALQIPSEKIPAHTVLIQADFVPVGRVKHPWRNIEAYCPYCGKDHCICDAVVYRKELP